VSAGIKPSAQSPTQVTPSAAAAPEERPEPSPDSNAQEPVTVRMVSEPPVAAEAKKSIALQVSVPASGEARESDPGMLEIESLSQGTLEPVIVDGIAETASEKDPDLGSATSPDAPGQSVSVEATDSAVAQSVGTALEGSAPQGPPVGTNKVRRSPGSQTAAGPQASHSEGLAQQVSAAPNRRNVVFLGLGGLCVLGFLVFALRPSAPSSNRDVASVESSPIPSSASVPTQPAAPNLPSAAPPSAAPPEPTGEDTVRVAINIRPEGARVFYRGKEVGRTPFTLELLRGERRVFEVGYPGYATRRLVIDGADKEVSFNLTQDAK
jgi:hypothetical protein